MALLLSFASEAAVWEELSLGASRLAHMDALGGEFKDDPYSVASNPAWVTERNRIAVLVATQLSRFPKDRVDESPQLGFFAFALQTHFAPWTLSILSSIPFGDARVLDTGPVQGTSPFWSYRARQGLSIQPGISFSARNYSAGISFPLSFHTRAIADLDFDQEKRASRLRAALEPSVSFLVGAERRWSQGLRALAVSYRYAQSPSIDVDAKALLPLPGDLSFNIMTTGVADTLYEPHRFLLHYRGSISQEWSWGVAVAYALWSQMPEPFLKLEINGELETEPAAKNLNWNPRDSGSLSLAFSYQSRWVIAYRYSLSPFEKVPAFYDSRSHSFGLGYTYRAHADREDSLALHAAVRAQWLELGGLYVLGSFGLSYPL